MTIPAIIAIALLLSGCSITGRTSDAFNDEIIGCSLGAKIAFLDISGQVQACYSDNSIYFTVENLGTSALSGMAVFLESDYNISIFIKESVEPGAVSQQSLDFGSQEVSGAKTLKVVPMVGDSRLVCTNAAVTTHLDRC